MSFSDLILCLISPFKQQRRALRSIWISLKHTKLSATLTYTNTKDHMIIHSYGVLEAPNVSERSISFSDIYGFTKGQICVVLQIVFSNQMSDSLLSDYRLHCIQPLWWKRSQKSNSVVYQPTTTEMLRPTYNKLTYITCTQLLLLQQHHNHNNV